MTRVSAHPHSGGKSPHGVYHSQSNSHHSGTKSTTHKSPSMRAATAPHSQQKLLLAQQLKSKNAAVQIFKTPTGTSSSDAAPLVGLSGVGGALAGLIPPSNSSSKLNALGGGALHSNNTSSASLLDRFKAASTPVHLKRSIREGVVDRLQSVLRQHNGRLGTHLVVGFNSIERLLEKNPKHLSVVVIAKDAKEELVRLLVKTATQQRVPFVVLPSFASMLRDACGLKSVFCVAVRSHGSVLQQEREGKNVVEGCAKGRRARRKVQSAPTTDREPQEADSLGLKIDDEIVDNNVASTTTESEQRVREESIQREALEAVLDDLRDHLRSLAESAAKSDSV